MMFSYFDRKRKAEQIIAYLREKARSWCEEASPDDDMTVILVRAKVQAKTARETVQQGR